MAHQTKESTTAKSQPGSAGDILSVPIGPGGSVSTEEENQQLRTRVTELEKELEQLRGKLGEALKQGGRQLLDRQLVAAQYRHGDLASLYVASKRLQATLKVAEVLAAIREIVINLIGVEEMAVFKIDPGISTPQLIDWHGPTPAGHVSIDHHFIRSVALNGDIYIKNKRDTAEHRADRDLPVACVPLKVDGMVWGVVVIFRLLAQKDRLVGLDHQLFDLLSVQAGIALHCAELSAERAAIKESSV
jgi:hypothetical protein